MENNIHIYSKCADCVVKKAIECRAFEIYEYRQEYNVEGDALQDWQNAEAEVMEKLAGGYRSLT